MTKLISLLMLSLFGLHCAGPTSDTVAHNVLTAEEAAEGWQLLFDGKTTEGWHVYGKNDTRDWEVKNGELIANGHENDLVTDGLFDNFELRLEWKVAPEGNSGIFYHVKEDTARYGGVEHTGPEYQLIDDEGYPEPLEDYQHTGNCYDMYLASSRPTRPVGEWNEIRLLVDGAHVEHWLNGVKILEYELWTPEWDSLKVAGKWKDYPDFGIYPTGRISLQNHGETNWFRNIKIRPLTPAVFNGENLEGWTIHGTELWYVEHGELICESGPDKEYGYLSTDKTYKDFELDLDFKQEANGNSGIFFRSSIEGTTISGWQAEVAPPGHDTGGIYESYGRGWLVTIPDEEETVLKMGEWNHMKLRVVGDHVQTWLNGVPRADLHDDLIGAATGFIALQIHDGGGIKVHWRNIRIRNME